jgi:hypothetical protein
MTFDEFNLLFLGMVSVMLLYNLAQQYLRRDRAYGYYTLYMLCWLVYFGVRYRLVLDALPDRWFALLRVGLPMLAYCFYFDFAEALLTLSERLPWTKRVFRAVKIGLLAYVVALVVVCLGSNFWQTGAYEAVHTVVRVLLAVLSVFVIIRAYRLRDPLVTYFVTGTLALVGLGVVAMSLTFVLVEQEGDRLYQAPVAYLQVGIVVELLCFSLALSYKSRQAEIDKAVAEQQLHTEREQRQSDRLRARLEAQQATKMMADLRLRALRSQMNPHFLFNSLNAIQECIITNQNDVAVSYLAKFSKLVRLMLEHSDKPLIPLTKEVETLRLYLDIEALRFTESFRYELRADTALDPSLVSIPPMLVQPYAENAIWHGLLNKRGERWLRIRFTSDDDSLFVTIEDNGIGRRAAAGQRNPLKQGYASRGMTLIDERLNLMNEAQSDHVAQAVVEDLVDPDGHPAGTRVRLTLPLV